MNARKIVRAGWRWFCWSLAGLLVITLGLAGYIKLSHQRLLSVQTNSMRPTFRAGDALLVGPRQPLLPGSVISYHSPADQRMIISHRIVVTDTVRHQLTTAGDALGTLDQPVADSQVVGRVKAVLPGFGRFIDAAHRPYVFLPCFYVPAVYLLGAELHRYRRVRGRPRYRAPIYR
jgi:signal peptidase I